MFSTQKNSGVYKASTAQVVYNVQVVVPVYLNNRCINALRVNGNSAITLLDSRLVESHQIVSGETIQLRGAFDDNFVEKPVADVDLRSPHFACNKNIRVKVAVTALPDNLQYIIGNTLFTHYSHFQDTIKVTSHSLATYIRQSLTSACLLTTILRVMFCEVARRSLTVHRSFYLQNGRRPGYAVVAIQHPRTSKVTILLNFPYILPGIQSHSPRAPPWPSPHACCGLVLPVNQYVVASPA